MVHAHTVILISSQRQLKLRGFLPGFVWNFRKLDLQEPIRRYWWGWWPGWSCQNVLNSPASDMLSVPFRKDKQYIMTCIYCIVRGKEAIFNGVSKAYSVFTRYRTLALTIWLVPCDNFICSNWFLVTISFVLIGSLWQFHLFWLVPCDNFSCSDWFLRIIFFILIGSLWQKPLFWLVPKDNFLCSDCEFWLLCFFSTTLERKIPQ